MPNWTTLKEGLRVSGETEILTVIRRLVQDLTESFVLVERGPDDWGVLRAADLAWLPSCKTMEELDKYFLPSFVLKADGLTNSKIADLVLAQSSKIALLSRQGKIVEIAMAPGNLGPGISPLDAIGVMVRLCSSCGVRSVSVTGSSLCSHCAKEF